MTPYGRKALDDEITRLMQATEGTRNDTLNRVAFNLMQIAHRPGGHDLAETDVSEALATAGRAIGLPGTEVESTIRSALNGALSNPRSPRPVSVDPVREHQFPLGRDSSPGIEEDPAGEPYQWVHWPTAWGGSRDQQWLLEPLIPMGGQTVLYSEPKVGKSLLALEIAAALAVGNRWVLGVHIDEPVTVMYVDHENRVETDIVGRLVDMGYDHPELGRLKFASYPRAGLLDTHMGGTQLFNAAQACGAQLVIIDTVSRTVAGEENSNDTWLAFYRHTGQLLKAAGIALMRLDHTGKDHSKGQRGGSAKSGDVDMVWRLSTVVDGSTYTLACEAHRVQVNETLMTLKRATEPLRHAVDAMGYRGALEARQVALLAALDVLGAPKDIGVVAATEMLRGAGHQVRNGSITAAMLRARAMGTL